MRKKTLKCGYSFLFFFYYYKSNSDWDKHSCYIGNDRRSFIVSINKTKYFDFKYYISESIRVWNWAKITLFEDLTKYKSNWRKKWNFFKTR